MRVLKFLIFAILSGLLLGAAWLPNGTVIIFIGFVPLLFLTEEIRNSNIKRKKLAVFLLSYVTFIIWNICDTWWIWFASEGGAIAAIVANSLLMALTYLLYFSLSNRILISKFKVQSWLLIPVWLAFEYLHTLWELAWTWLTIGNVFAFQHNWIQWYEFTGVSGGTLWVLVVNILFLQFIQFKKLQLNLRMQLLKITVVIMLPILLSYFIKSHVLDGTPENTQQVLIVQPNIDPYNDKFNGDFQGQLQKVCDKVKNKITDKTNYLELPETFLTENLWENKINESYSIKFLKDSLLSKFPNLNIIIGATTFKRYDAGENIPATARAFWDNPNVYYDVYNTAIQLNKNGLALYHKSKLVPGVERMPYPALFKPLEKLAINLGGTFGSLGVQETRDVFLNNDKSVGIAPVVCYESIFGEYVTEYIKNGANIIFIITNDGWWSDSPGYKHHLAYAKLRAIETRKQIARSANTGISCLIDETGEIHAPQPWWKESYLMANINPNRKKTLYVRFGDVLSKLACLATFLLIGYHIFLRVTKRNNL